MTRMPNGHGPPRPAPPSVPPLAALSAELERVLAANQAKLAAMSREGTGIDPLSFLHARIDCLISSVSKLVGPQAAHWAVMARLEFEQQVAAQLEEAEEAGRKANLAAGGQFTPAMIAELARQAGVFGRRAP